MGLWNACKQQINHQSLPPKKASVERTGIQAFAASPLYGTWKHSAPGQQSMLDCSKGLICEALSFALTMNPASSH